MNLVLFHLRKDIRVQAIEITPLMCSLSIQGLPDFFHSFLQWIHSECMVRSAAVTDGLMATTAFFVYYMAGEATCCLHTDKKTEFMTQVNVSQVEQW